KPQGSRTIQSLPPDGSVASVVCGRWTLQSFNNRSAFARRFTWLSLNHRSTEFNLSAGAHDSRLAEWSDLYVDQVSRVILYSGFELHFHQAFPGAISDRDYKSNVASICG